MQRDLQPAAEPPPARRLAILTSGGPLLVDVRLTVAGQPLDEAWSVLAKVSAEAEEPPPSDGKQGDRPAPKPLVLRSSRAYAPDGRVTSNLWAALDADRDGRLAGDEIAGAVERLWLRDADDDRIITARELASLRDQLDGGTPGAMRRPSTAGPASARLGAIEIVPQARLERIDFILQDLYSPLQDLSPGSFSALPRLFDELDADDDDVVVRDELARLATIPASLDLRIEFSRPFRLNDGNAQARPVGRHSPAVVTVLGRGSEITELSGSGSDRVVFAVGRTRLVISAHDLGPRADASPREPPMTAQQNPLDSEQIRLMVHDRGDSLLAALDSSADGRLSEREIAAASAELRKRDADSDGMLTEAEAPYQMVVAFMRSEPRNAPPFSEPPPSLAFPVRAGPDVPAWFAAADLNGDGDLSGREFLGPIEQFERLDVDGDGFVVPREAAGAAAPPSTP